MKKIPTVLLAAAVGVTIGAFTLPNAQNRQYKTCFVVAAKTLEAHPKGPEVKAIRDAADKELKPLQAEIQALQQKLAAGTATAADRQTYDTKVKTYQATAKKWQEKVNKVLEPITKDVDAAVAKTAQKLSCALVLDRAVSGGSGLVVYADKDLDITDEVVAALK